MKVRVNGISIWFWCPGCEGNHRIVTGPDGWTFNGNAEKPTITPSILVGYRHGEPPVTSENIDQWHKKPWPQTIVNDICHSFITDGKIEFLADCTHKLAGQTVELPDWVDNDTA